MGNNKLNDILFTSNQHKKVNSFDVSIVVKITKNIASNFDHIDENLLR